MNIFAKSKKMGSHGNRAKAVTLAVAFAVWSAGTGVSNAALLTNGSGDGQLSVDVTSTGSFGTAIANSNGALYNPVGAGNVATTTFESFLSHRFGGTGGRTRFDTIAGTFVNSSDPATSVFSVGGLNFGLTQTLTSLFNAGTQIGTQLSQTYSFVNTSTSALDFELVRYLDGDLDFDNSLIDGGGRFVANGTEFLFETDSATGALDPTTLVAITGEGGTAPLTNRFEIDRFSGLRDRITNGTALDDTITNDGIDADQFIDAGQGYDVTLGLRNTYSLGAGASGTYLTRTIFGSGSPAVLAPPPTTAPVPEPGTMSLMGLGLASLVAARRRKKKEEDGFERLSQELQDVA